ncbi:BTAD domain-containing putative transcriptional regulator [Streptomyces sp. NPDC086023]|uniref:AfsR/SARP family transcriptional regulator n=1 Tax=Streptomyces sp. NPDC086023 TaxID=3365746 RepID=UPI0037D91F6E
MDIDVLGGLEVLENGVPITPATPQSRQVLAVLAAHTDQVVPVAVLAEELEAHAPPEHTRAVLHSCVRQLRDQLGAALGRAEGAGARTPETVLVSLPGGYLLDTGWGRSDLHEFEREAGAGYRAMARGDYETAARRLRGALLLWKGPAFDGVTAGARLGERIAQLEATRLSVLEQWVEAELALGRHQELRTELSGLIASYQGREAGSAPYLSALRRSGRRAESLETYRSLADALRADVGRNGAAAARAVRRALLLGTQPAAGQVA